MGEVTLISWCDSTCNGEMGCDGCELWNGLRHSCYAGILTERQVRNGPRNGWPTAFNVPQVFPRRIDEALEWKDLTGYARPDKPWLNGMPRLIFLDDMGDTFTESLDLYWLRPFLERMERSPHQWLVLTKRPKRAEQFFHECGIPGNFWVGTSVTDQATANARIPALLRIPAKVKFLSCEPMLDEVELRPYLDGLDWVIVGGESGVDYRVMDLDWALEIRDRCVVKNVPFFYKQSSGTHSETDPSLDGTEWRGMPTVIE